MTKICCVCRRVEDGLHWREGYGFTPDERISHGYCPLCFDVIMAELMEIKNRRQNSDNREHRIDAMFQDRIDMERVL